EANNEQTDSDSILNNGDLENSDEELQDLNQGTEKHSLGKGSLVKGNVTKIEAKHALVDVGYKVDGIVPISELSSLHIDKVSDVPSEGDEIELKITKISEDELVLSKKEILADKAWEDL